MKIKVEEENLRIDKYLASIMDNSRSEINKMLASGDIILNKKRVKPSYKLKLDDEIEIINEYVKETNITPSKMPLDIIYEDDDIMVINKPSGVVVHPGSGNKENTLANGLLYYTNSLSNINGEERPGIVHRIDKDTSGLMLVAKSNKAHKILSLDFQKHLVKRDYIALLVGNFTSNKAIIDAPIGRNENKRKEMCVTSKNSKKAITHLEVIERYKGFTLVRLSLETGRTHQIRVHMKYIGYPVFNDPVYNKEVIKSFGQFLHSKSISFTHPILKKKMYFEVDLPDIFKDYLDTLEKL